MFRNVICPHPTYAMRRDRSHFHLLSPQSGSHGVPQRGEPACKTRDERVAKPPILSLSYSYPMLSHSYRILFLSYSYPILVLSHSYPSPIPILSYSYPILSYPIPILSYPIPIQSDSYPIPIPFLFLSYPILSLFLSYSYREVKWSQH